MKVIIKSIESFQNAYDLWKRCGIRIDEVGSPRELGYKTYFEKNPDMFVGAYVENKLVGLAIYFYDGRKSWIYRMAVSPEYRKNGIATYIVRNIEKLSKKNGACSICAMVEKINLNSKNLFNKLGYHGYDNLIYFTKDI